MVQTPSGVTIGDGCRAPEFESMLEIDEEGEVLKRRGAGRLRLLVSTAIAVRLSTAGGGTAIICACWSTGVMERPKDILLLSLPSLSCMGRELS